MKEGWRSLFGAKVEHYFRGGVSLCEDFKASESSLYIKEPRRPCGWCRQELAAERAAEVSSEALKELKE